MEKTTEEFKFDLNVDGISGCFHRNSITNKITYLNLRFYESEKFSITLYDSVTISDFIKTVSKFIELAVKEED